MKLTTMARQLLEIDEDLPRRIGQHRNHIQEIHNFDQTCGSTALGFGGMGGSAMTTERTYVIIPDNLYTNAYVYFGSRFAYECNINDAFWEDLKNHNMASVMNSGKYNR